jgi:hypothetical protein
MIHLDFPARGSERATIIDKAFEPLIWEEFTEREKIIFVQGMNKGYFQGVREQAQNIIDNFTMKIIGFRP